MPHRLYRWLPFFLQKTHPDSHILSVSFMTSDITHPYKILKQSKKG